MDGQTIAVRSLTNVPTGRVGTGGNAWQYHPQSDRHSKLACWGILYDLLQACPLLADHVSRKVVAFGINHEMRNFRNNKKKDLDLVLCRPGTSQAARPRTMRSLVDEWNIELTAAERDTLQQLPDVIEAPVGMVHIALEAKAVMTEHVKALSRFYDELNSSHQMVHGASDFAIAAGLVMINVAPSFISPGRNHFDLRSHPAVVTQHNQPRVTERTIEKVGEIPRRTKTGDEGFDALAIVAVDCKNDGSPITVSREPPAPQPHDIFEYDGMIRRIAHLYESRFSRV